MKAPYHLFTIAPSSYTTISLVKIRNTPNGKGEGCVLFLQSVEPVLSVIVLKYIGVDRKE